MDMRQLLIYLSLSLFAVLAVVGIVSMFQRAEPQPGAPAAHVETDNSGGVKIDAPYVHIEKNSEGTKVQAPGVDLEVPNKPDSK